jgi:DNA-binding response OmpR family regulator
MTHDPARQTGRRHRVLVADDEPLVLRLVRDILGSPYDIESTESGRDVLRLYHEGDFDLLILDAGLRSLSGMEIVSKLREGGDEVPIILMSGTSESERREGALAFTYRVGLLRKPFGVRDLRSVVERLALD